MGSKAHPVKEINDIQKAFHMAIAAKIEEKHIQAIVMHHYRGSVERRMAYIIDTLMNVINEQQAQIRKLTDGEV